MKNHETNHTRKAAGGRPQGRTGHRAKQGKIAAAGTTRGAGKVGEGAPSVIVDLAVTDAEEMLSVLNDRDKFTDADVLECAFRNLLHWGDHKKVNIVETLLKANAAFEAER